MEAVLFRAKQCIVLKATNQDLESFGNHGNFLELLQLLGKYNDILHWHLVLP